MIALYKLDRLLTGLTAQQKGTTARWYSNKISLFVDYFISYSSKTGATEGWVVDGNQSFFPFIDLVASCSLSLTLSPLSV